MRVDLEVVFTGHNRPTQGMVGNKDHEMIDHEGGTHALPGFDRNGTQFGPVTDGEDQHRNDIDHR